MFLRNYFGEHNVIVTNKRSDKNRTKFVIKEIRFQYACSMNVDTPKGKDHAETKRVLWKRGSKFGEGDGGVHRRQNVIVARGNARGFPEGLEVLYQQSPAIYHL